MCSWIVYDKTGGKERCKVHALEYNGTWMGETFVSASIKSPAPIDFGIGDFLVYRGETFEINYDPTTLKKARKDIYGGGFVYDGIKFNSLSDELTRCDFLDYVKKDNTLHYTSLPKFSFYAASVQDLADRIQANLDRIYTGEKKWTVVVHPEFVDVTNVNIDVQNIKVWDAVGMAYSKFKASFIIRGRTITIGTAGIAVDHLFRHGKGNGLTEIERVSDTDQQIVTRLHAYGSDRNMPPRYYAELDKKYFTPVYTLNSINDNPQSPALSFRVNLGKDFEEGMFSNRVQGVGGETSWMHYNVRMEVYGITVSARIECFPPGSTIVEKHGANLFSRRDFLTGEDAVKLFEIVKKIQMEGTPERVYIVSGVNLDKVPASQLYYPSYIPNNLAVNNLMLPGFPDETTDPYIDSKNAETLGIREGSVYFDGTSEDLPEIYPSMEGMTADDLKSAGVDVSIDEGDNGLLDEVASAEQVMDNGLADSNGEIEKGTFTVTLKDIGFDINEHLTESSATISMKSGKCGGREFEITNAEKSGNKYVLTCKRVYDNALSLFFPYNDYNIQSGDKFVLLEIRMPDVYVKAASQRLYDAAKEYLSKNDYVRYTYVPKIDDIYMARQHDEASSRGEKSIHDTIKEGDLMLFEDDDLGIDGSIVIDKLSIKEGFSMIPQYSVTLRNEKVVGTIQKIQNQVDSIIKGGVQGPGGYNSEQIKSIIKAAGRLWFLSKDREDSTAFLVRFLSGICLGKKEVLDIIRTTDTGLPPKDDNVYSALATGKLIEAAFQKLSDIYLRSDVDDTAHGAIRFERAATFVQGLVAGLYEAGGEHSSKLHPDGLVEAGRFQSNGPAEFRGQLSSPDFVSGFTAGKGWGIRLREQADGTVRTVAEFDEVVVRGALRVFEFIVSQMLGENDNRTFTAMMEVDHYDPATGRIWLDTQDGRLYNPFRKDDCIVVQQYNGMPAQDNGHYLTKQYSFTVAEAGTGGAGEGGRLDWLTFRDFATGTEGGTPATLIARRDTLVRIDNLADPSRKGIIQLMTVGTDTPHMDVLYGKHTDPGNALKTRLGNLQGVHNPLFGWLNGWGLYTENVYAVGQFRIAHTGQDVADSIEMLKGSFRTRFRETAAHISDGTNFLRNGAFAGNAAHWKLDKSAKQYFMVGGRPLYLNRNVYSAQETFAGMAPHGGTDKLRLLHASARQANADIDPPTTHRVYKDGTADGWDEVPDTMYLALRYTCTREGTLTFGFKGGGHTEADGALRHETVRVEPGLEAVTLQRSGTWDGKGDFEIVSDADVYIDLVALTTRPLDNLRTTMQTGIDQNASGIRIWGEKVDGIEQTTTQLGIDLGLAEERLSLYAGKTDTLTGTVEQLGIDLDAAESKLSLYATKTETLEGQLGSQGNALDALTKTVTQLGIDLDATEGKLSLYATKEETGLLDKTLTQLGIDLDAATGRIDTLATRTDTLDGTTTALGQRLDTVEGKLSLYATREEVGSLRTVVDILRLDLDTVEGKLGLYATREETNAFGERLTQVASELDTARGTLENYVTRTESLEDGLGGVNGSVSALGSRMDAVEKKFTNYVSSTELQTVYGDLSDDIDDVRAFADNVSLGVADVVHDLSGVKKDLSGLENGLAGLENGLSGLEDGLAGVNVTLERHWTTIEQTATGLQLAYNKSTGYALFKDLRFARGENSLMADYTKLEWLPARFAGEDDPEAALQAAFPGGERVEVLKEKGTTPLSGHGLGGISWPLPKPGGNAYEARFTAKAPKGYTFRHLAAMDPDGSKTVWLTPRAGTGAWADYRVQYLLPVGKESGTSFLYIVLDKDKYDEQKEETPTTVSVAWHLKEATVFNLSAYEDPVAAINLSESGVRIKGDKIELEGVVTANKYFRILQDGSMEATAGHVGGWLIERDRLRSDDFEHVSIDEDTSFVTQGKGALLSRSGLMVACTGADNGLAVPSSGSKLALSVVASGDHPFIRGGYIAAENINPYGSLADTVALELSAKSKYWDLSGGAAAPPIGLKVSNGYIDAPGVLAWGRVRPGGTFLFARSIKNIRIGRTTGSWIQYELTHNLGHTRYVVAVVPVSENATWRKTHAHVIHVGSDKCNIAFIDSGTNNTSKESDFFFALIGDRGTNW